MHSSNQVCTLSQGALLLHSNGDHNHVSRHKSYSWMETGLNRRESFSFGVMPSSNIPDLATARQDLSLTDSQIGAFEPSLYAAIIQAALTLVANEK